MADSYSEAEIERMASKWREADSFYGWASLGDHPRFLRMQAVREVLHGYTDRFDADFLASVLAMRARIDAERAPAPSVEEVINGLLWHADHIASGLSVAQVNLDKLRAFLSALPDEARRVGMAGMKGGK